LLLEAGKSVMPNFPNELRKATTDLLSSKKVKVLVDTKLVDYNGRQITLGDGGKINTRTLIWTAGVKAAEMLDSLGVEQAGSGRVRVADSLQIKDHAEVFIIGDAAYLQNGNG